MQTLGLIYAYFVLSMIVTMTVTIFKRKNKGAAKVSRSLINNLFFGDLLRIFVFGLLELGAASIMSFSDPHLGDTIANSNLSMSILCVVIAFLLLPFIYTVILRQNRMSFDSPKFQYRFGRYTMGANLTKKNPNSSMTHIFSFLLKRYALLLIAFIFDNTAF